jgi:hypothetical protein
MQHANQDGVIKRRLAEAVAAGDCPGLVDSLARKLAANRHRRHNARLMRDALDSIGVRQVRGSMGGVYYE